MEMQINIDKDAVHAAVVQAIMNSAFGEELEKAIKSAFQQETGPWGDRKTLVQRCVDSALENEIRRAAIQAIQGKSEEIKAKVAAMITQETVNKFIEKAFEKLAS